MTKTNEIQRVVSSDGTVYRVVEFYTVNKDQRDDDFWYRIEYTDETGKFRRTPGKITWIEDAVAILNHIQYVTTEYIEEPIENKSKATVVGQRVTEDGTVILLIDYTDEYRESYSIVNIPIGQKITRCYLESMDEALKEFNSAI